MHSELTKHLALAVVLTLWCALVAFAQLPLPAPHTGVFQPVSTSGYRTEHPSAHAPRRLPACAADVQPPQDDRVPAPSAARNVSHIPLPQRPGNFQSRFQFQPARWLRSGATSVLNRY